MGDPGTQPAPNMLSRVQLRRVACCPHVAFRRPTRDAHLLDQPFGYCAGAARASPTDEEAAHNVLWRCGYVCELRSLPAQHPRVRMPQQWLSVR